MTLCLRLCGFVDGGGLIDSLFRDALNGDDLELFGYGNICQNIHSSIFIDLILLLLIKQSTPGFSIVNVGSGQELTTFEIATIIKESTNSLSKIVRSLKPPRRNDFVFKIDKLLGMTELPIPSLADQIIDYVNSKSIDLR